MDSKKNFDLAKAIVVNHVNAKGNVEIIDMDQVEYLRAVRKENTLMILLRAETSDEAYYKVLFTDGEKGANFGVFKCVENAEIKL